MPQGVAIAGLVIGVSAEKKRGRQLEKAEEKEERARQKQRDIQDVQTRRQRVAARKQARTARAESVQAAVNQGASTSSAAAGAGASAISQFAGNVSFLDRIAGLTDQQQVLLGDAAKNRGSAATFGSIGQTAFNVFEAAGGFEQIFSKSKTKGN